MSSAKTNVYRSLGEWCHATWVDGDFDCSGSLELPDSATESEAIAAAKDMLAGRFDAHEVNRVDDVTW